MTSDQKILEFAVGPESELLHLRLDVALGKTDALGSRSKAASAIGSGHVLVNGKLGKASHRVERGDLIRVELFPADERAELIPLDLKLDIVYEDDACLVINKPSGLVVHPAAGHRQDTLVNALLAYTTQLSGAFGPDRPGIVHRLDRDTSGLIVVAKTEKMHRHLATQFRDKTVRRLYWAVTIGTPPKSHGRIESILARHPQNRKKFASTGRTGKRAVTHYRVVADYKNALALMALRLETGRTHQIRVHLSELGFPIAGDSIYGNRRGLHRITSLTLRSKLQDLPHLILHAAELGFHHPERNEILNFKVGWPAEIVAIVSEFGWQDPSLLVSQT